jgi:hypothetical protein
MNSPKATPFNPEQFLASPLRRNRIASNAAAEKAAAAKAAANAKAAENAKIFAELAAATEEAKKTANLASMYLTRGGRKSRKSKKSKSRKNKTRKA